MTGGKWDAGFSVVVGGKIMLEEINRHSGLLPGYELKAVWQDDQCNAERSHTIFLDNHFNGRYWAFPNDVNISELDVDGDGTITSTEGDRHCEFLDAEGDGSAVGYLGMGCSSGTMKVVRLASYARIPVVSATASFAGLSNREEFPNFFRTLIPDSLLVYAFVALAKLLAHPSMVPVTGTATDWPLTVGHLVDFAATEGVALVGEDLSGDIPNFRGLMIEADLPSLVASAVRQLIRLRQRIVVVLHWLQPLRMLLCEGHKRHFTTAVYMFFGWLEHGWWHSAEGTSCSPEQITAMATGSLAAKMVHWRMDRSSVLSCSENMTVQDFMVQWFARQGAPFGDLGRRPEGYALYEEASNLADAVCMYAQALHQLLVLGDVSLAALRARTPEAYKAMQAALGNTDFEGIVGRVKFVPGATDPVSTSVGVKQLQAGGKMMEVATYTRPSFTFAGHGNLTFHFPQETAFAGPAGASTLNLSLTPYAACPGEQVLFANNSCLACPENMVFSPYLVDCLCSPGYVGPLSGPCEPCAGGRFSSGPGTVSCQECEVGRWSSPASTSCSYCPRGSFSSSPGSANCSPCPALETTKDIASTSLSDCVCQAGSYSTSSGNGTRSCVICPEGSSTEGAGSSELSSCACREGSYMAWSSAECKACPTFMHCPKGSSKDSQLLVQPRFWASAEEPLSLFKCRDGRRCPGGRPGNACAPLLRGVACEHCAEGYHWDGDQCRACLPFQRSLLLYPVLPIMAVPLLLLAVYFICKDPVQRWGSWQNSSAALGLIVLNHYQILSITAERASLMLPARVQAAVALFAVTSDVSLGLSLECTAFKGLLTSMTTKALAPVVVALWGLLAFSFSLLAHKCWPSLEMERNRLFNAIGSLIFTFFGAISAMSLVLFTCPLSPNGQETLSVDLSVICWSSATWQSALAIGISCVLLYIIGLGSLCVTAVAAAPRHFSERGFQMRWKFLFIKFHPGAYWWSLPILAKMFCVNLIPVLLRTEAPQLYLCMTVNIAYLAAVVVMMPYRVRIANLFELLVGVCITYVASLWYALSLITLQKGLGADFEGLDYAALVVSLAPAALLPVGTAYNFFFTKLDPSDKEKEAAAKNFHRVRHSFLAFCDLTPSHGARVLLEIGDCERDRLLATSFLINTDIVGFANRRRLSSGLLPELWECESDGHDFKMCSRKAEIRHSVI